MHCYLSAVSVCWLLLLYHHDSNRDRALLKVAMSLINVLIQDIFNFTAFKISSFKQNKTVLQWPLQYSQPTMHSTWYDIGHWIITKGLKYNEITGEVLKMMKHNAYVFLLSKYNICCCITHISWTSFYVCSLLLMFPLFRYIMMYIWHWNIWRTQNSLWDGQRECYSHVSHVMTADIAAV